MLKGLNSKGIPIKITNGSKLKLEIFWGFLYPDFLLPLKTFYQRKRSKFLVCLWDWYVLAHPSPHNIASQRVNINKNESKAQEGKIPFTQQKRDFKKFLPFSPNYFKKQSCIILPKVCYEPKNEWEHFLTKAVNNVSEGCEIKKINEKLFWGFCLLWRFFRILKSFAREKLSGWIIQLNFRQIHFSLFNYSLKFQLSLFAPFVVLMNEWKWK